MLPEAVEVYSGKCIVIIKHHMIYVKIVKRHLYNGNKVSTFVVHAHIEELKGGQTFTRILSINLKSKWHNSSPPPPPRLQRP